MESKRYCALALDMQRNVVDGSPETLRDAIRRAADLRIYTEFRHNEHIDGASDNNEMIREVSDFPATYLIEDRWAAGIMTLRQPVTLPDRFGSRSSMSFFMYNEDGHQAFARPYLDSHGYDEPKNPDPHYGAIGTSKYHTLSEDACAEAPSQNFIYDFYSFKFFVQDVWEEIYAHDADGNTIRGSAAALDEASNAGQNLKVAITGICEGLWDETNLPRHELFIECGPHYYYSETGYMVAETRPFVRVRPSVPMVYEHQNWDFGWAIVRSDGHVAGRYYDPYTMRIKHTFSRHAMRWFTRK
ncbi:MAG: hypothetical protein IJZ08_07210 [Clostridia bacterium]|nr:hypothetical protein [Clostridia bacterium]